MDKRNEAIVDFAGLTEVATGAKVDGHGAPPAPRADAYLLALTGDGLQLYEAADLGDYPYWVGTEEGYMVAPTEVDRWWLFRVSA
jgi:hypothetical protein